jgi:hypothetical protein
MHPPLEQHQAEIQQNLRSWEAKPLLQEIYAGFYNRIVALIDERVPGRIVEIGSGIGNLRLHLPRALATDLFPNPWLDLVCDGYELPFCDGTISHLVFVRRVSPPRSAERILEGGAARAGAGGPADLVRTVR